MNPETFGEGWSNDELVQRLVNCVIRDYMSATSSNVVVGPLEIHDFSFCIGLEQRNEPQLSGIYIKLPKQDVSLSDIKDIGDQDRIMASRECHSLERLETDWPDTFGVSYVRLLGYLPEFNALITKRAFGQDFSVWLRGIDLALKFGYARDIERGIDALERFGRSLAQFHWTTRQPGHPDAPHPDANRLAVKLQSYTTALARHGVGPAALGRLSRLAAEPRLEQALRTQPLCDTLKGLDLRNIVIDDQGDLHLFDPGRLRPDSPFADFARFQATLKLLYWGRLSFFARLEPDRRFLDAVCRGYFGPDGEPAGTRLHHLKECARMWLMAHTALALKPWPASLKFTLRRAYIDPFFQSWLGDLSEAFERG
ncbi:MAG: hypothetical protein WCK65_00025 [Rhodospirillaceae bacterium]